MTHIYAYARHSRPYQNAFLHQPPVMARIHRVQQRAGGKLPPYSVQVLQLAMLAYCRHELGRVYEEGRSRCGGGQGELMLVFPSAEEMMHTVVRDVSLSTSVLSSQRRVHIRYSWSFVAACVTLFLHSPGLAFCGTHERFYLSFFELFSFYIAGNTRAIPKFFSR